MDKDNQSIITKAQNELDRLFHAANNRFFNGEMPTPVITIQTKGRMKAYGWHYANAWKDKEGKRHTEINISAEHLARGAERIAETLLHEMAHLYNSLNKVEDCSSNQYHNKYFANTAKRLGLNVERSSHGWSSTTLTEETRSWIKSLDIDEKVFQIARIDKSTAPGPTGTAQKKNKMKKWSCGCTNVRCAVDLVAYCKKCGGKFELE